MSTEILLEADEHLIFQDCFQPDRYSQPFAFAVTDRAVFVSKEKHFARESWYFERIPISQIKQVLLLRERAISILILSSLIFLSGLTLTVVMMIQRLNNEPGSRVSGVPIAMIVCGIVMPFLAKGRRILVVESANEIYKWKPKIGS